MKFTDEDLKRVKEDLENFEHKFISIEACRAILARLEAAEQVCDAWHEWEKSEGDASEGRLLYGAGMQWLKSKGEARE